MKTISADDVGSDGFFAKYVNIQVMIINVVVYEGKKNPFVIMDKWANVQVAKRQLDKRTKVCTKGQMD